MEIFSLGNATSFGEGQLLIQPSSNLLKNCHIQPVVEVSGKNIIRILTKLYLLISDSTFMHSEIICKSRISENDV